MVTVMLVGLIGASTKVSSQGRTKASSQGRIRARVMLRWTRIALDVFRQVINMGVRLGSTVRI
jgi:hypothetical protein